MYKKKTASRRTYKKKTYKRKSYAKKTSVKRIVKQVLARQTEVKGTQTFLLAGNMVPPVDASNFDAAIIPVGFSATGVQVAQGSGQGNRVGNKITLKNLNLKMIMTPNPYNVTTNPVPCPIQVRAVVFYDKENPTSVPAPAVQADIFAFGNTSNGFEDDLVDMMLPFNTDRYKICADKVFKLGYSINAGTGVSNGSAQFANNDFKLNQMWKVNLTKFLPKTIQFQDNDTNSTTHQLFVMLIPAQANGIAMSSAVRPANFQYVLDAKYTDA